MYAYVSPLMPFCRGDCKPNSILSAMPGQLAPSVGEKADCWTFDQYSRQNVITGTQILRPVLTRGNTGLCVTINSFVFNGLSGVGAGDGNRTHVASFQAESLRNGLKWPVLNGLEK